MEVTNKHIETAIKNLEQPCNLRSLACPVALSISEKFEGVSVSSHMMHLLHKGRVQVLRIGQSLANWITQFDLGDEVKPITITLIIMAYGDRNNGIWDGIAQIERNNENA